MSAPLRSIIVITSAWLLGGCTFVQLTDGGAEVVQASAADVTECIELGTVETSTRDKVVVQRGDAKVTEELTVLARNRAAQMGANAIVPVSRPDEGNASFKAYSCN
ncbi:MAG: DUF4156 domain-containing protein [Pseudomonadota bacterium]